MGSPKIAADILEYIIKSGIKISAAITRPDKPKGRGKELVLTDVKQISQKAGIPVFTPTNKAELTELVENLKPDMVIVAAFGMMLPPAVFDTPKYKALNVHPSLLPKYRGPAPIEAPILNGDTETGVSIMLISEGMDEGDILAMGKLTLKGTENSPELEKKLANLGGKLITDVIPKWVNGEIAPLKQTDSDATYTKMLKKDDGKIDWENQTASQIEKLSRAFTPWPGIYTFWNGKKLDFYNIEVINYKLEPGKVELRNSRILIGTKEKSISPKMLKIEGKNKVTADDFIRGYSNFIGSNLT